MKHIDNLSAIDGRILIRKLFRTLRYERQYSGITTLFILWRVCASNSDINNYTNTEITVLHKLGFYHGTVLWLEEIINKFYFSTIQSLVYFGAAVLLILLGINRFYDTDASIVIYGIVFEVAILILIFFIMLFSPSDDIESLTTEEISPEEEIGRELIEEIGEISKDFAITSTQLENITSQMASMISQQNIIIDALTKATGQLANITNPNPQMIETMQISNKQLADFNSQITNLINITKQLKQEEIHSAVRQELETFLTNKIDNKQ